MSLFMGNLGAASYEVNEEKLKAAESQLESFTQMFTDMVNTCRDKCFPPHYAEEELAKGEMCCIDRCVSKYFTGSEIVGKVLREEALKSDFSTTARVLPTLGQHKFAPEFPKN